MRYSVTGAITATLLLAGSTPPAVATHGDLDQMFGQAGVVTTDLRATAREEILAVAVQPDGSVVAGGFAASGSGVRALIVRYTARGRLDKTFDRDGGVVDAFGGTRAEVRALTVQNDGKILIAGVVRSSQGRDVILLARLTRTGEADATFGTGGIRRTDVPGTASDVAEAVLVEPGGRIVVGATSTGGAGRHFTLLRYSSSGQPDSGFGSSGVVLTPSFATPSDDALADIRRLADGRYVAAGTVRPGARQTTRFGLARYTAAGALDTSFSEDGRTLIDVGDGDDRAGAMLALSDGRVLVAGQSGGRNIGLARVLPGGGLDPTWAGDGTLQLDFGGPPVDATGLVLVGGHFVAAGTSGPDAVMARFSQSGEVVRQSGQNGRVYQFGTLPARVNSAATSGSDGNVVLAGAAIVGGATRLGLLRAHTSSRPPQLPPGSLVTDFHDDGILILSAAAQRSEYGRGLDVLPDGRMVAAGLKIDPEQGRGIVVARLQEDGDLDTNFAVNGVLEPGFERAKNHEGFEVLAQDDGRLRVGVSFGGFLGVMGILPSGFPDESFGLRGIATVPLGENTMGKGFALARQPDGKVVVAGGAVTYEITVRFPPSFGTGVVNDPFVTFGGLGFGLEEEFRLATPVKAETVLVVARLNADGSPDRSFGQRGARKVNLRRSSAESLADVVRDAAGGLIGVGTGQFGGERHCIAIRLKRNGKVDREFGGDGLLRFRPRNARHCEARAVALTPRGNIMIAGVARGSGRHLAIAARVKPSGRLDRDFDRDGIQAVALSERGQDIANAVVVDRSGRTILAGYSQIGDGRSVRLARLLPSGALDRDFGLDAIASAAVPGGTRPFITSLDEAPNGDLLAVGHVLAPKPRFLVLRFRGGG